MTLGFKQWLVTQPERVAVGFCHWEATELEDDLKGWCGEVSAGCLLVAHTQKRDPIAPGSSCFVLAAADRRFPVCAADAHRGGVDSPGKPEVGLVRRARAAAADQRPRFELATADRGATESVMSQ